jgi:signal peptidase II
MKTFMITAAFTIILDQFVKSLVKTGMAIYQSISVIKNNILNITYIENSGISFGVMDRHYGQIQRWVLVVVIFAAITAIVIYWARHPKTNFLYNLSCGLILGGACGNLIDRIFAGRVVDFIEIGYKAFKWPVFNIADCGISCGVFLFVLHILFER